MTQIKCLLSVSLVLSLLLLSICSPISSAGLDDEAASTSKSSVEAQSSNSLQQGIKHLATDGKLLFFGNWKIQVQIKRRGGSVRPPVVPGSRPRSSAPIRKQASFFQLNAVLVFSISCVFFLI